MGMALRDALTDAIRDLVTRSVTEAVAAAGDGEYHLYERADPSRDIVAAQDTVARLLAQIPLVFEADEESPP